MRRPLRHGYTTGACAAAAARGAALMLARRETVSEVTIDLPAGVSATFELHGQEFGPDAAACFVVKDAGDDPDVTDGVEVHATVTANPSRPSFPKGGGNVVIEGGTGIGRATKPGLAVAPGEWAINPVPRQMITEAVRTIFPAADVRVEISIPDGEERAKKTLNARLGIVGGLSILGTSGIVRPISAKAWTDTIDAALDVARACGSPTVVLSTGRTSEMAAQKLFEVQGSGFEVFNIERLPEEAYIMMGDHVAHAARACQERGFDRPVIACQFAKLLKIACGHENTHAVASEMDLSRLRAWADAAGLPSPLRALVSRANTAREIALESRFDPALLELVCRRARDAVQGHAPGIRAEFLVADYGGNVVLHWR
ncbi:MAG TPA: cobalt-precorrin-5B (C(1))-methyltransferase CbiD [Desulfuromonadaceae bacterium]